MSNNQTIKLSVYREIKVQTPTRRLPVRPHPRQPRLVSRANPIEDERDAMASDDDVEMVEADLPRFSTAEKGKGKAAEPALPEEDNGLPWCVNAFVCFVDF